MRGLVARLLAKVKRHTSPHLPRADAAYHCQLLPSFDVDIFAAMGFWQFFIDRGGTFTDCLAVCSNGVQKITKVLSSDDAPLTAIRQALELEPSDPIPSCEIRMGTTLATNALLERRGASTLLLITRGFADLLEIGTQARPEIFALDIKKAGVLYARVLETEARGTPDGRLACEANLLRAEHQHLGELLRQARDDGLESAAIVVLNGHACPELERALEHQVRAAGFSHVSTSHASANELGLLARADTTVLDAYLTPRLTSYFTLLQQQAPAASLLVMQSSGDLVQPQQLRGPQSLLSGPAGGVVACEYIAQSLGLKSCVGFDMGGTSTDVCRIEVGTYPRRYESTIAGVRVVAPMMDVHTVAAGGGSICRYDGGRFRVGPESAGANPGPACYGNPAAENLTVTDVNFLLGRLVEDNFPFPLHKGAAEQRLAQLAAEVHAGGSMLPPEEILSGLLAIADYNMADAIREVSLRRGFDVRNDALVVFGGAGGQHACAIARELGIKTLIFPLFGGVLSACGMACARRARHAQQDAGALLLSAAHMPELSARLTQLLHSQEIDNLSPILRLDLRYQGGDARLTLDWCDDYRALADAFHAAHAQRFGYCRPNQSIEVVTLRTELVDNRPIRSPFAGHGARAPSECSLTPVRMVRMLLRDGAWQDVPLYKREHLPDQKLISGPACIIEQTACIVIEAGFQFTLSGGHIVCHATDEVAPCRASRMFDARADPVTLELIGQAFMGLARQMGTVLQRTATSTNIRERLDFSCAVFDHQANLIANAPHIPVHLGAMGETVRHIARAYPHARPGEVFVSNDPHHGGSHLPDITVVTPVFNNDGQQLRYWLANRGHHADVGGISPGSMPAFSSRLDEEGVVLSAVRLVSNGEFQRDEVQRLLSAGKFPARAPEQNLADLQAQVAANHFGFIQLRELETRFGATTLQLYMAHLQDHACQLTTELIHSLPVHSVTFRDHLDDGTPIGVEVTPLGARLRIRFEYTPESAGNSNAPRAVVVASVLYVLRCLLGTRLPLNAGCLRPLDIEIPPCSLLDPGPERAVSSGNVETSQRLVDVLLGCLGAAAASQGTMNNVTFGDHSFGYYETIAGGAGAGPTFSGASGVHTHMTNTRITDPELLESKYPVELVSFELRRGSGGMGARRGGDGCIREYRFKQPLTLTLVSERRVHAPFGLKGGQCGQRGVNRLNGELLPGRCQLEVSAGDILRVETPGGGGYGAHEDEPTVSEPG